MSSADGYSIEVSTSIFLTSSIKITIHTEKSRLYRFPKMHILPACYRNVTRMYTLAYIDQFQCPIWTFKVLTFDTDRRDTRIWPKSPLPECSINFARRELVQLDMGKNFADGKSPCFFLLCLSTIFDEDFSTLCLSCLMYHNILDSTLRLRWTYFIPIQ